MIDQDVGARDIHRELDHRGAARRDEGGLDLMLGRDHAPLLVDVVKDLPDHVEGGDEIGAAVADVEAELLADLGGEGPVPHKGPHGAVEHDVCRLLVDRLVHVEALEPLLAVAARGVEISLHDVVLTVDPWESLLWLHQDQPVHAVGDVHPDGGRGAVVHIEPGVQRLERELGGVAGGREGGGRAAARACDGVQVDVVRHLVSLVIVEVKLDLVSLANPDEASRHIPAKRPEQVLDPVGQPFGNLPDLDLDGDLGGMFSGDGRGDQGGLREHGPLLGSDFRVGGLRLCAPRGGVGGACGCGEKQRGQENAGRDGGRGVAMGFHVLFCCGPHDGPVSRVNIPRIPPARLDADHGLRI